ncbi:MAG: Do family serine endopeptidase [Candidatus Rokubacteria bacterium]|nr:Do family serine endopeptidase [Candidatus Rokubacteria bacterium]
MNLLVALVLVLASALPAAAQPAPEARAMLRAMEDAFTAVANRVMPSVVNVSTTPKRGTGGPEEIPEQFKEFFDEFRRRRPEARASGSGVIVDPNGYILTNNHVIENAAEIIVRLSDARKFTATLVGRDPKTDLAVLKVDAPAPLPAAELGDSDGLRVGQWAIAIGNPFGLDRTVTVGIVSGTARTRVGVATYESFIQTDASINPGNSGGPLLNLDGHVIGVNTAIVASGQGIGFAIPINQAKDIMRQLMSSGRVVRGWLGIMIQDMTEDLAPGFGVQERQGVLVANVMPGGPAESAGVKIGDVIVEFGGAPIRETPDLQRRVASVTPGQPTEMKVIREGQPTTLRVTVGEMPSDEPVAAADTTDEQWGLRIEPIPAELPQSLPTPGAGGVVVAEVAAGSPAEAAGLKRGDVILEIAGKPIPDAAAFTRELAAVPPDQGVRVYIHRPGGEGLRQFVMLERRAEKR